MADYYLDFKFNGYQGVPFTMALVRDDLVVVYVGFKDSPTMTDPWVFANAVPVVGAMKVQPRWRTTSEIQHDLEAFFKGDSKPHIITDWPADIMYFSQLITTGPGTMINVAGFTFEIKRVDAYPTTMEGAVQHNALSDALALKYLVDGVQPDYKDDSAEPVIASADKTASTGEIDVQTMTLLYSPTNGSVLKNMQITGDMFRKKWPELLWYFNPWTGEKRSVGDQISDPAGKDIKFHYKE